MKNNWLYLTLSALIIGCGSTESNTKNDGEGSIDLRSYLEKEDVSKNYQLNNKSVGQTLTNQYYAEVITVSETKIERTIEGIADSIVNIEEKKLTYIDVADDGNINTSSNRYVDIGDTLFSTDINSTKILTVGSQAVGTQEKLGSNSCKLIEELNEFTKGSNTYTGDILKTKCTKITTITTKVKDEFIGSVSYFNGTEDSVDISYFYYKKDIGLISSINDDCILTNSVYPEDTTECSNDNKSYSYTYYLGN
jgi:hypothetical protein